MKRVILSPLKVRVPTGVDKVLPEGSIVDGFHIVRQAEPGAQAYLVEFEWECEPLVCPLHSFLPRTRVVEPLGEGVKGNASTP